MAKAQAVAAAAVSVVLGCLALTSCTAFAPVDHAPGAASTSAAVLVHPDGLTVFAMPPLVGVNLEVARDQLLALGSSILDQRDAKGLGRSPVIYSGWKVCAQDPAPGALVPIGQMITLTAAKLAEAC